METVECGTCGGSNMIPTTLNIGEECSCHRGKAAAFRCSAHQSWIKCAACFRGRQPSPKVIARMAQAHAEASGFISPPDDGHDAMRAAWLAEHQEAE